MIRQGRRGSGSTSAVRSPRRRAGARERPAGRSGADDRDVVRPPRVRRPGVDAAAGGIGGAHVASSVTGPAAARRSCAAGGSSRSPRQADVRALGCADGADPGGGRRRVGPSRWSPSGCWAGSTGSRPGTAVSIGVDGHRRECGSGPRTGRRPRSSCRSAGCPVAAGRPRRILTGRRPARRMGRVPRPGWMRHRTMVRLPSSSPRAVLDALHAHLAVPAGSGSCSSGSAATASASRWAAWSRRRRPGRGWCTGATGRAGRRPGGSRGGATTRPGSLWTPRPTPSPGSCSRSPRHLDAVVLGGDAAALDDLRADRRLAALLARAEPRVLDVPEPRRAVLDEAARRALAVEVVVRDPRHDHRGVHRGRSRGPDTARGDHGSAAGQPSPPVASSPPSTRTVSPVIHDAASETRKPTSAGHVLRRAQPAQRVRRRDLLLAAGVERRREPGPDDGRRDGVDPDPRPELPGQLLGQPDQRRLGRPVRADVPRRAQPRHRGHVDHRATVHAHPRAVRELHEAQRRHHVDVEDLAHGLEVGVHERPELRVHAGVVDQDREPAERRHRGVDGLGPGGGVARVAGHGEHPGRVAPRRSGDELGGRGGQLVRPAPGDRDRRAAAEQLGGDRPADPAARPRDQRRPTRERGEVGHGRHRRGDARGGGPGPARASR